MRPHYMFSQVRAYLWACERYGWNPSWTGLAAWVRTEEAREKWKR